MTQVLVRYKAKPEHIAGNDQVVRTAHDELQCTEPGGFQKATFQARGGVTQVHWPQPRATMGNLLGKLGAANRTEAVTRARQLGLIP
jgi:hypothetical protein